MKALSPIDVSPSGRLVSFTLLLWKARFSMLVTLVGRLVKAREVQLRKVPSLMVVRPGGRLVNAMPVPSNAMLPMSTSVEGRLVRVMAEQNLKAPLGIVDQFSGRLVRASCLQFWKVKALIVTPSGREVIAMLLLCQALPPICNRPAGSSVIARALHSSKA